MHELIHIGDVRFAPWRLALKRCVRRYGTHDVPIKHALMQAGDMLTIVGVIVGDDRRDFYVVLLHDISVAYGGFSWIDDNTQLLARAAHG